MDNYEKIERLGEGRYGVAYKVKNKESGELYCMKEICVSDETVIIFVLREILTLRICKNENIIPLLEVKYENENINLLFPLMECDLYDYMKRNEKFTEDQCLSIIKSILEGLDVIHSRAVLHRDLKSKNILIKDGKVCIADFGLARSVTVPSGNMSPEVITLWYRPPELLGGIKYSNNEYGPEVDIWSAGCILYELCTGNILFNYDTEISMYKNITYRLSEKDPFPEISNPKIKELLKQMLKVNINERISAKNALRFLDDSEVVEETYEDQQLNWKRSIEWEPLSLVLTEKEKIKRQDTADWLYDISKTFKLCTDSFYYAINLMDLALKHDIKENMMGDIKLLAVVCLHTACCIHELYPMEVDEYIEALEDEYTEEQFRTLFKQLINNMSEKLTMVTAVDFYRNYNMSMGVSRSDHNKGKGILALCYVMGLHHEYSPDSIAKYVSDYVKDKNGVESDFMKKLKIMYKFKRMKDKYFV
ncbi:serine-threonine kinase [Orpheovirus IHUMI-LCC2]|uniref:Cyclin-dependent kinase n=1 Tax=Orpheovirus IHUMI-LCC2 TaxID=2023057 RepID=A0A2I2L647_9VIRU|nr:serine-threonine kinase [Orpheovirus IHUMI-LCC2]SNW63013.1 Cyclin-dependent kinase [Orpheovirus IHUMI-LCC2]